MSTRCIQSRKNHFKIHNLIGYYFQKYSKTTSTGNNSSSSSSSSESDDPKLQEGKNKNEEKLQKLNELLMNLIQQDKVIEKSNIDLTQAPNKRKKEKPTQEINEVLNDDQKMVKAVKDVANEIGGDIKTTESELLMKLLSPQETAPRNLTDIIKDMQIDREKTFSDKNRADQVRSILQNITHRERSRSDIKGERMKTISLRQKKTEKVIYKIDLFGGEPLGIFTNADKLEGSTATKTWEKLQTRDLRLAVTQPPSNYFQQMILWTEQGKVWTFPIDNEQGLDEEKKVHFSQHVFLEELLEPWCPQKGPIRHFMELVCVGLSKNSYLSVQAKRDHIDWFKSYFENKKALLEEVGALQDR